MTASLPQLKKIKTTTATAVVTKPGQKKAGKAATVPAATIALAAAAAATPTGTRRIPRKTAADLFSGPGGRDDEGNDRRASLNPSKGGKPKPKSESKSKPKSGSKSKPKSKKASVPAAAAEKPAAQEAAVTDEDEIASDESSFSENEGEDNDRTAMLLQGFESSDDEDDANYGSIDPGALAKEGLPEEKKVKKKLEKLSGREEVRFPLPHCPPNRAHRDCPRAMMRYV